MIGFGDDEFVGYTFSGPPERRPRLWFLDRQICVLLRHGLGRVHPVGDFIRRPELDGGEWTAHDCADGCDEKALEGVCLRYENRSEPWTAVWRLTDVTIPHVHTFGQDDTWRLGLWPD